MSTPAGWYDDGSGRQRWWDGTRWTDDFAPEDTAVGAHPPVASDAPTPSGAVSSASPELRHAPPVVPATAPEGPPPTLGYVGLGLAVLGTILACIPTVVTFVIGIVVLLAAFVVSLIAVFRKNTKRWPSIVGIVLSIVGGIIGGIVFSVVLFVSLVDNAVQQLPTDFPTSVTSEQPSEEPTDDGEGRPTPEAIAEGYVAGLEGEAGLEEYKTPEVAACIGQYYYDSDVSDALLQEVAAGEVITEEVAGTEADLFREVVVSAATECGPQ
ncbi:DUF2510 domain-containing protein [Microbacterium sp.]|uniref:DUF2510 domain-containing protein n=1 Tax=Microbacterium sp. TaxID=51671 RepID=UPI002811E365|nr:DUF2510 domain-containing protein [Microbacterium sp.]